MSCRFFQKSPDETVKPVSLPRRYEGYHEVGRQETNTVETGRRVLDHLPVPTNLPTRFLQYLRSGWSPVRCNRCKSLEAI